MDIDVVRVGPISSRLISTFGKCERDTDVGEIDRDTINIERRGTIEDVEC